MKRLLIPIIAALAICIALGVWWFSPEQIIKRRTKSFLKTITIEQGSGGFSRGAGVHGFSDYIAKHITLENPDIEEANGEFASTDVQSGFAWLANNAKQMTFKPLEFSLISAGETDAQVDFTLQGLVEVSGTKPVDGKFQVIFFWKKQDDRWRLSRAKWSKIQ